MTKSKGKQKKRRKSLGTNLIRLSDAVVGYLKVCRGKKREPLDETARRLFGLPTRKGEPREAKEFFILWNDGQPLCFTDRPAARGVAIQRAVQKELGWTQTERIITAREVG